MDDVFPGESAMSSLMRTHDWDSHAIGAPSAWPNALKIPLRMMLTSRFEMWLGWGPDLMFFYNDAYVPTLGNKHPLSLGQPMREVWKEVYANVEDRIRRVMDDGIATWDQALLLLLERSGRPEETYHTFSYSPLRGDSGRVEGLMCVVTEETKRVIGERRLQSLSILAAALLPARHEADVLEAVRAALAHNQKDFPFCEIVLLPRGSAEPGTIAAADWPLDDLAATGETRRIDLKGVLDDPPLGFWDRPATEALLAPIMRSGSEKPAAVLILGLNPFAAADDDIGAYAALLATQISGALTTVAAYAREAEEKERLRVLFERSPSFMALLEGPDHRFALTNPSFLTFIGQDDVIGQSVEEVLPEAVRQGLLDLLHAVYASGEAHRGHDTPFEIGLDSGETIRRRCDFVLQPIRDAAGHVTSLFLEGADVSERARAAEALRRSEAELRALNEDLNRQVAERTREHRRTWEVSPEILGILNTDGFFETSNPAWQTILGWSEDEIRTTNVFDFVHPDDIAGTKAALEHAQIGQPAVRFENRYRTKAGDWRWLSWVAAPERGRIYCSARDITIEKQQATELARSTADRNRMWQLSTDVMLVAGFDSRITALNPAWKTLMGWDPEDLLGRGFIELVHPDDRARTLEEVGKLSAGATTFNFENRYQRKDGSYCNLSWTAVPDERFIHAVGRDVTAEREAEAALARTEDALRQAHKMEAVGQLTGGIAHDFNNMLAVVMGSLDLLKRRLPEDDARAMRYADSASEGARRAALLTQRLLAFSRLQPLKPEPLDPNHLVASMSDLLRHSIGADIRLETVLAGGVWRIFVDRNQLENVILNLAVNSRDAMPDGGRLTIETQNSHLDSNYASANGVAPGQYLMIAVTDTGSGMTEQVTAKAFDPFFTTKEVGKGTGLGLSQVYGFIKQSGGHVKIYSEPGVGTTIKVYLPRLVGSVEAEPSEGIAASLARGEGDELILVVEDEPSVRQFSVDALTELGYRVVEADNAERALALLDQHRNITLLFTDIVMPDTNGRKLADEARRRRPDLKVLFTTGYTRNAIVHNGVLDPGVDLIGKPYSVDELAKKVRDVLDS